MLYVCMDIYDVYEYSVVIDLSAIFLTLIFLRTKCSLIVYEYFDNVFIVINVLLTLVLINFQFN